MIMQGLGKRFGWSATKTRWIAFIAGFVVALLVLVVVGIARSDAAVTHGRPSPARLACPRTDPCGTTSTPDWESRYRQGRMGHSAGYRLPQKLIHIMSAQWASQHKGKNAGNFCQQPGITHLCFGQLRDDDCVLWNYQCQTPAQLAKPSRESDLEAAAQKRVVIDCGSAALIGGAVGAIGGPVGILPGMGGGVLACGVSEVAHAWGWW